MSGIQLKSLRPRSTDIHPADPASEEGDGESNGTVQYDNPAYTQDEDETKVGLRYM